MKWSNAPPSQAGYFWFRDHKRGFPSQVVEVVSSPKMGLLAQKEFQMDGELVSAFPKSTEWAGPILLPSE